MNRQEYFAAQREITRKAARAETEAARRIRAATRAAVMPLVKQYLESGSIAYPKEELAAAIEVITREEGAKPVEAARALQADMETSLAEKLHIAVPRRLETQQNAQQRNAGFTKADWERYRKDYIAGKMTGVQWRLFEAEYYKQQGTGRQSFSMEPRHGRGWGYGASRTGVSAYRRDPQTGKIIWDDTPLEYAFRKRADLSTLVWKAVEEQEQMVFDVIRGGSALGRNVKDIGKDLETFINYGDGGKRVVGRWKGMFPDTRQGIKDAYLHQYVQDMGLQWGTPGAHNLLYEKTTGGATRLRAGFRQYLDERMALVKFDDKGHAARGSKLPDAVKQYVSRLGKAGLDYRAIRISRTETAAMLADEQTDIARNSAISTGEMDFVMERGRDAWGCNCEKYASQNPWKVDDPNRPEIPVHPSCGCVWRPRLKTDTEIMASFRESMKEDLEVIHGKVPEDDRPAWQRMEATKDLAMSEYPDNTWVEKLDRIDLGPNIRAAETRTPVNKRQKEIFQKELQQARMLADEGRTVYFLPEQGPEGKKHPDAIIDGRVTELKTITGKLNQVWDRFNEGRKKSDKPIDVFLYIDSRDKNVTQDSVLQLLSRKITVNNITGGRIILRMGESGIIKYIMVE